MDRATEERVRQRAYELWQLEGCPAGREQEHWDQAVKEISQNEASSEKGVATDADLPSDLRNVKPRAKRSEEPKSAS